ncbi:MAG TPA: hypothetical protein VKB72_09430 [Steroidobacteraceae bacterium]|nr:hypothetical protein [Steroidobacteraceae bacterium]
MTSAEAEELGRFMRGEIDAACFPHREHVRMAFLMLRHHDFPESVLHYSRALRLMTARAGKPEAFHQTLTIAFLSLIAERLEGGQWDDFAAFTRDNPDLLDKGAVARCYRPERLANEHARRTFLLP